SVQRRHQKVIEEAPGPGITPDLRARMGEAAVAAARAVAYEGAGTVEFLLDAEKNFYFLEMNTRLQVEHAVTEMITGLDLVAWQIAVAEGRPLPLRQEDVALDGHAIEARLYAEDPWAGFLPRPGRAEKVVFPEMPDVRVDHGLADGEEVPPFYDPMIAKIIARGETRDAARRRLIRALKATHIHGIETNRSFLIEVLEHAGFAAGKATTEFLDTVFLPALKERPAPQAEDHALAALLLWLGEPGAAPAAWGGLKGWSSSGRTEFHCRFDAPDGDVPVRLEVSNGLFRAGVAGAEFGIEPVEQEGGRIVYRLDGVRRQAFYRLHGPDAVTVDRGGHAFRLHNRLLDLAAGGDSASDGVVLAPMHGRIRTVHVRAGERVNEGGPLMVLEAMKMEHDITAPVSGTVSEILVADDEQVAAGARLVIVNAEET
ncbi:MAG: biotin/lipoyl-containing protein, partial [Alphaproteobacteria bacterium]